MKFARQESTIMRRIVLGRRSGIRRSFLALAAVMWLPAAFARADDVAILFTASTDYTGGVPNADGSFGYSYPNDPTQQNPYLPAISPGVTLVARFRRLRR